ncbi:MAG: hypothetical protein HXS52_00680 [Theionarchaea archaeon]|nr:hypothetical protein [Theionarchaea archaeon]
MEPKSDFEGHSTVLSLRKKCDKSEADLPLQEREHIESQPGCPCSYPASVTRGWFNG